MEIKQYENSDYSVTVSIKNLVTGYKVKGSNCVIGNKLNAELIQSDLTCLIGPNGAGKSTLLRTLAAFQKPLSGDVYVMNKNLKDYSNADLSKIVSVVLTDNSSIKNLSAKEVVSLGRTPYTGFWGRLTEKDKLIVDKCLKWVGAEHLKDRKMQTLSDGERQKIMIAKAVAQETPIILLDEPTAFLDYPSKVAMMLLLHRLSKALHKTIFLSTHDLEHALQVADHIWLIDKEKGLVTGSPEDLSLSGKIEEFFVKDCMRYDPVKQIFDIQYQFVHSFPVVTDDKDNSLYILLCKAMSRNGIKATDRQSSDDYFMKVEGSKFCMMKKGSVEKTTSSIEEAVDFINKAIAQIKKSEVVEEEQSVAVESAAVKE